MDHRRTTTATAREKRSEEPLPLPARREREGARVPPLETSTHTPLAIAKNLTPTLSGRTGRGRTAEANRAKRKRIGKRRCSISFAAASPARSPLGSAAAPPRR